MVCCRDLSHEERAIAKATMVEVCGVKPAGAGPQPLQLAKTGDKKYVPRELAREALKELLRWELC